MTRRRRTALFGLAAAVAIAAALVALVGGDDADRPVEAGTVPSSTSARPPSTTARTTPSRPATPTIVVRDGRPVGGIRELRFEKGSTIRFAVRSDVADEVHLHAYDVAKEVAAGGTVRFSVPATIDGRFVVELERRAVEIAEIEVVP